MSLGISDLKSFGRIGVLMGGYSAERDISLKSGQAIYQILAQAGYTVEAIDIDQVESSKIKDKLRHTQIDIAFIALHGLLGEDGRIQSILDDLGIAYTGSYAQAHHCAFNKHVTHRLLSDHGIQVPAHICLVEHDHIQVEFFVDRVGLPVVVKPVAEGSSIGIAIVDEKADLDIAIKQAFGYGSEVLIEQYVPGRELTVGIVNDQALPVVEIVHHQRYFDFQAKYKSEQTEYHVPADLTPEISQHVQKVGLNAFHALGCQDFARIDMILNDQNDPIVIEVNTIPGFTSTSLLPKAAKAQGMDFLTLCETLIELAYAKTKKVSNTC